jgi:GMP synthase (glutamine-hydrolysing)
LPDPDELDCLVVMGGPMSAWEEREHPWLRSEKRLIEHMIELGKPLLGICLGAQLVADVLGARIYRGARQEIGWFTLEATGEAANEPVGRCLPHTFDAFLWHADSFDLPSGAVHLARSEAYQQQAFVYGSALALQFHLEVRPEWVRCIAERDADQLIPDRSVQGMERIVSVPESLYRANNRLLDRLLDAWLESLRHRMSRNPSMDSCEREGG